MSEPTHFIYGLLNDRNELFYVGVTENVEKRMIEQRRLFAGVTDLRVIVLAGIADKQLARMCERTLISTISEASDTLVNDHHHANRFEPLTRARRQLRFWRHVGSVENVKRLEEEVERLEGVLSA